MFRTLLATLLLSGTILGVGYVDSSSAQSVGAVQNSAIGVTIAPMAGLTTEVSRAEAAEASAAQKSNNLSDLTNTVAARANLGLGSAATQSTSAFDPSGSASSVPWSGTGFGFSGAPSVSLVASALQTQDWSPFTAVATGTSTSRSLADRAADVINVKDFGAVGNGTTDDSGAINAALSAFRTLGPGSVLYFPGKNYLVDSPLNFTSLVKPVVVFNGAHILCQTGAICLDFSGTTGAHISRFYLTGEATNTPTIGVQFARNASGGSENHADNFIIDGSFTQTAWLNMETEDFSAKDAHVENDLTSSTSYTLIQDGYNFWNALSSYATMSIPANTPHGMDTDTWTDVTFVNKGTGHTIWVGNSHSLTFTNSYTLTPNSNAAPVVLFQNTITSTDNGDADFGMHFETNPSNIFLLSGPQTSPSLVNFQYHERGNQAGHSIFALDSGVTSASFSNLRIYVPVFFYGATVFDQPSAYTVTGNIFVPSASNWATPGSFSGCVTIGALSSQCTTTPNGLSYTGSISSISISTKAGYLVSRIGTSLPTVVISTPQFSGGTQAAASISSMSAAGINAIATGGTGYSVNDVLTATGGTGSAFQATVTSVGAGGTITGVQLSTLGSYTTLPSEPVTMTGGSGTGATLSGVVYSINGFNVTAAGSGYYSATVTVPNNSSGSNSITANLNTVLTMIASSTIVSNALQTNGLSNTGALSSTGLATLGSASITGNETIGGNQTVTGSTTHNGNTIVSTLGGGASTASITAGAGAGTAPTVSVSGKALDGVVTITTGTSPPANSTVATVTFGSAFVANIPRCTFSPAGAAGLSDMYLAATATTLAFDVGATALAASTTYYINYQCLN